jgi:UDP-2,4-diacetamido-2,4,6-trideoxy-beta-L-altropyranose hydrolase
MGTKPKVYFRADGNAQIGLGHVIRSLALAEMLKDDFDCHFIIQKPLPTIKMQILATCSVIIELDDGENSSQEAIKISHFINTGEIIVLDGYHFITAYQKVFKDNGIKVVCIDDIHAYHFVADVVINHALGIKKEKYSIEKYTKLCLGLQYSLLRKPFLDAINHREATKNQSGIFISFGGADFNNHTLKAIISVMEYPLPLDYANIYVVLGAENQHKGAIMKYIEKSGKSNILLKRNLTASQMCKLIRTCGLAIVPASTISIEVLALQIRMVCGYYADNQINYYENIEKSNFAICVGDYNKLTHGELNSLIRLGLEKKQSSAPLLDGLVSSRMVSLFKSLYHGSK